MQSVMHISGGVDRAKRCGFVRDYCIVEVWKDTFEYALGGFGEANYCTTGF